MSTASGTLFGREPELAQLIAAIDAAAAREASFLLVVGEAGIGKSRLLAAAHDAALERRLRVLHGVAFEAGAGLPFMPLVEPLRALVADMPSSPAAIAVKRALLGEAATGDPRASASDGTEAARVVGAIHDLLVERPTLLLIDDVQWADASTLAVLDYLAHRGPAAPIAVIAAARDDERAPLERLPIADGRRYRLLSVPRLTRAAVASQVAALFGSPRPRSHVDAIFDRSAGNPFFVELLVDAALSNNPTTSDDHATPAPLQLRALVARRIGRLEPGPRRAFDALGVIGRAANADLIAAVADERATDVTSAMRAAVRVGVAVATERGFDLRHPLFGEAIRGELTGPERALLHRRAAEALTATAGDPAEIAEHWWLANDLPRARESALVAANAAERARAYAEVRLHLERALNVWPAGSARRSAAAVRAARAAWIVGDPASALQLAREAERSSGDAPGSMRAIALFAQGEYAWDAGDRPASVRAFNEVASLVTPSTSPATLSRVHWGLGRARVGEGRHAEGHELALQSVHEARLARDRTAEAEALLLAGMAVMFGGELDVGSFEDGLRIALDVSTPSTIGHAYQFLVDALAIGGEAERAIALAREGIELGERLGLGRFHVADLRGRGALLLLERGMLDEAEVLLELAERRAIPELARARLAMHRADWALVDTALADAATAGAIGGPGSLGGWAEITRAETAWLQRDRPGGQRWLDELILPPGTWGRDVAARAALLQARIHTLSDAPGSKTVSELVQTARGHPNAALGAAIASEIEARGRPIHERVHVWPAVIDAWRTATHPIEMLRAGLAGVEIALAAGERAHARAELQAVAVHANDLGITSLLGLAQDLGRRARLNVAASRRAAPDVNEPTRRELDVLRLLADGRTNREIGGALFLSPKTVEIHVTRLLDKLGAHTRGEAVANARRRGLLP